MSLVVMGVAGCGKSSLGQAVAAALGWPLIEGDDYHPPRNVALMRSGVALTDADRAGWLDALAARLADAEAAATFAVASEDSPAVPTPTPAPAPASTPAPATATAPASTSAAASGGVVMTCSALKRAYRDRLRAAAPGLRFVHLVLAPDEARRRVAARPAHLFPPTLVASQFATLESPAGEAGVLEVDATLPIDRLAERVCAWLKEPAR